MANENPSLSLVLSIAHRDEGCEQAQDARLDELHEEVASHINVLLVRARAS